MAGHVKSAAVPDMRFQLIIGYTIADFNPLLSLLRPNISRLGGN